MESTRRWASQEALVVKNPSAKARDIKDAGLISSLIRNCSNPPFGTQGRSWRLESVPYKKKWGTWKCLCVQEPHGILVSFRGAGSIPGPALWPHSFSARLQKEIWLALASRLLISEALRVMRVGFSEKQSLRWNLAAGGLLRRALVIHI